MECVVALAVVVVMVGAGIELCLGVEVWVWAVVVVVMLLLLLLLLCCCSAAVHGVAADAVLLYCCAAVLLWCTDAVVQSCCDARAASTSCQDCDTSSTSGQKYRYRHILSKSLDRFVSPWARFWNSKLCFHGLVFGGRQTCKSGARLKRARGDTAGNSKSEPVETHTD